MVSSIDPHLNGIVFKACLVAVWTDNSMSVDERRYLTHLTEMLANNEDQRRALKELRLQDVNEEQVLAQVALLNAEDKAYVLDTCLSILASDRSLGVQELTFLNALRKTCGIGYWPYRTKRLRAQKSAKARMPRRKWVLLGCALVVVPLVAWVLFGIYRGFEWYTEEVDIAPKEQSNEQEIVVSTRDSTGAATPTFATGQEVYDHVRKSIVTVHVSLNNWPTCSGSGSVIGEDESGLVYVITNKHVVHNGSTMKGRRFDHVRVQVEHHSGGRYPAKLDFYSREHDLALLSVKGMKEYTEPLKLTLKSGLRVGQPIYAVGSPMGLTNTFTAGVVSALRDDYLQTDATIHYGSSGGPLVDQHGALCAVVTLGYSRKNYSFAQYADTVLEVIEERRTHEEEPPEGDAPEGEDDTE